MNAKTQSARWRDAMGRDGVERATHRRRADVRQLWCKPASDSRLRCLRWVVLILAIALSNSVFAIDNTAGFIVPAYGNPCCAGGVAQWASLIALGTAQPTRLVTIVTPTDSTTGNVDPNYVFADGTGPIPSLIHTGSRVIGYVDTNYGGRALADVEHDIDSYYSNTYWRGYPIRLSGIFFDRMSSDLGEVGYYETLRAYVRNYMANAWIVGNPGVTGTSNTSGQTTYSVTAYASVFDSLIVFEDIEADFREGYVAPSWISTVSPSAIAMLVHTTPSAARMHSDLSLALHRGAGWVFVTDSVLPNTYNSLPTFWTDEMTLLPQLIFVNDFE